MKAKLIPYGTEGKRLLFYCEGCKSHHAIPIKGIGMNPGYEGHVIPAVGWEWNGDMERPSTSPSIRTTTPRWQAPMDVCHIWITDGIVEFYSDDTSEFAGQKRPLPDLEEGIYE